MKECCKNLLASPYIKLDAPLVCAVCNTKHIFKKVVVKCSSCEIKLEITGTNPEAAYNYLLEDKPKMECKLCGGKLIKSLEKIWLI